LKPSNESYTIYFNKGMGWTAGGQLGFRRVFGAMDAGLQLQLCYVQIETSQGISETTYTLKAFYPAVQAGIGYNF
jgi:hypothetical protein